MIQKTSFELVLTPQEAEKYHRTIHRAISLLLTLPPLTASAYEQAELRADLMRLAMLLDDAVLPPVPPPLREKPFDPFTAELPPDPFVPEGDGSARDVLLGRLYDNQREILGYLARCTASPGQRERWKQAKVSLEADWREYEELSRG